jgi:iron complex transport system permease protein
VYGASYRARGLSLNTVLLAGVAVGLVFSALLSLVLVLAGRQAGDILGWLLGSLSGQSWDNVAWLSITSAVGLVLILWQADALDTFLMGEEAAAGVGVDLNKVKLIVLGATVLLVAGAVAFCGLIGFVGLIVPHVVRKWTGPAHRWSLLTSASGGAALLVVADLLSRLIIPSREIPVGIITGCLGGPFFLYLLMSRERHA